MPHTESRTGTYIDSSAPPHIDPEHVRRQAAVIIDQNVKLSVFATRPAITTIPFNFLTEVGEDGGKSMERLDGSRVSRLQCNATQSNFIIAFLNSIPFPGPGHLSPDVHGSPFELAFRRVPPVRLSLARIVHLCPKALFRGLASHARGAVYGWPDRSQPQSSQGSGTKARALAAADQRERYVDNNPIVDLIGRVASFSLLLSMATMIGAALSFRLSSL